MASRTHSAVFVALLTICILYFWSESEAIPIPPGNSNFRTDLDSIIHSTKQKHDVRQRNKRTASTTATTSSDGLSRWESIFNRRRQASVEQGWASDDSREGGLSSRYRIRVIYGAGSDTSSPGDGQWYSERRDYRQRGASAHSRRWDDRYDSRADGWYGGHSHGGSSRGGHSHDRRYHGPGGRSHGGHSRRRHSGGRSRGWDYGGRSRGHNHGGRSWGGRSHGGRSGYYRRYYVSYGDRSGDRSGERYGGRTEYRTDRYRARYADRSAGDSSDSESRPYSRTFVL